MNRNLFVLGYARHGKDTFAELLRETAPVEIEFVSSSIFVAERAVFPTLSERYGYKDLNECFEDRISHREEWKRLIADYNSPDKTRLSSELFAEHDIYVGLRCREELAASRHLAGLVVWVDRSDHLPPEDKSSNTITPNDADLIIPNNGTIQQLRERARRFAQIYYS